MNQTIYLVKKNPAATGNAIEWLQLTGKEFYQFTRSAEAKGRYFIRLTDDIDYECQEIFIEATYEDYRKWKKEYNAHQYLMEQKQSYETISADALVTSESSLVDQIPDMDSSVEDIVMRTSNLELLSSALRLLTAEEQEIVRALFLREPPLTIRESASVFGLSKSEMARQKKRILEKLAESFGTNP